MNMAASGPQSQATPTNSAEDDGPTTTTTATVTTTPEGSQNPSPAALVFADDVLYGLDAHHDDAEAYAFLREVVASSLGDGEGPREAVAELVKEASLGRGVEEWEMVMGRARGVRRRWFARGGGGGGGGLANGEGRENGEGMPDLLTFVGAVMRGGRGELVFGEGGEGEKGKEGKGRRKRDTTGEIKNKANVERKRRPLAKSVSRFWGEGEDAGGEDDQRPKIEGLGFGMGGDLESLDIGDESINLEVEQGVAEATYTGPVMREEDTGSLDESTNITQQPEPPIKTKHPTTSPFFSTSLLAHTHIPTTKTSSQPTRCRRRRPPRGTISSLPIPPLSAPHFGLIQEELAHQPFRLLVATRFLIKTKGHVAIPVFRELMERFPTPKALADADPQTEVLPMIEHLGLGRTRCAAVQRYARVWAEREPRRGVRFAVRGYPVRGEGEAVDEGGDDELDDDGLVTTATANHSSTSWEIGHLTQGPYALDSWRIFCRDVLLGRASDWKGKNAKQGGEFQPEWMRVLPKDKELRACLRWMWMREGWEWDPETGEREVLEERMRRAVEEGRVGYDEGGGLVVLREG